MSDYFVYIMSNVSHTLYTGVTHNLERRVYEHQRKLVPGFTKRYNITLLVYYETYSDPQSAIELIETMNPEWLDLSADWFRG